MSTINPIGADAGLASVQQQLASSQAVGVENIKPQTRQNETVDAAPGLEHAQSSQNDAQYSHVRYIARNAFMTGQGSGMESLHSDAEGGGYITKKPEAQASGADQASPDEAGGAGQASAAGSDDGKSRKAGSTTTSGKELTDAEQEQVKELKSRDSEVRQHELAHQSAGGQYASSPSYDYQTGPDGNRYAIGGHVDIDVSKESTPEKTIEKMQKVIQAAHAPADPSGQDLRVAAEAQQTMAQAQAEKVQESSPASGSSDAEGGDDQDSAQGSDDSGAQAASASGGAAGSSAAGKSGRSDGRQDATGASDEASDSGSAQSAAPQPSKKLSDSTSITGNDSSPTATQAGGAQI